MKRFFCLFCLGTVLLTACGRPTGSPEDTTGGFNFVRPPVSQNEPVADTTDYDEAFAGLFDGIAPANEEDFDFVLREDGSAVLTAYHGSGERMRVPDTLGGGRVTAVGDRAFADLTGLSVLILPDTVTEYGSGVLENTAVSALRLPFPVGENQGFLGYLWGATSYADNNLSALRSLTYLDIRASEALPDHALYDCSYLLAVRLPDEMTRIGDYAFYQCNRLRYVNADGLAEVGSRAFDACGALQTLTFGQSLRSIGFAALRDCNELMTLTLPFVGGTCTENRYLGYLFGATSPALSQGFYPPFFKTLTLLEGCDELAEAALFECRSLTEVRLPATLTAIGARALYGCSSLQTLTLPEACTFLGDAACAGCSALQTVTLSPNTVLGIQVFLGCPAFAGEEP